MDKEVKSWTIYSCRPRPKTIKKNTNSTPNKFRTQHAKAYKVASFPSTAQVTYLISFVIKSLHYVCFLLNVSHLRVSKETENTCIRVSHSFICLPIISQERCARHEQHIYIHCSSVQESLAHRILIVFSHSQLKPQYNVICHFQ